MSILIATSAGDEQAGCPVQAVASGVLGCSRFRGRRRCGSWPARTRAGHPQCSACSTGRPRGRQPSQAPGQHSSLRRPSCLHAPAPAHCQQQMCQQPDPPLSPPPQQLWAQLLQARSVSAQVLSISQRARWSPCKAKGRQLSTLQQAPWSLESMKRGAVWEGHSQTPRRRCGCSPCGRSWLPLRALSQN